jgi:hypothetical protein
MWRVSARRGGAESDGAVDLGRDQDAGERAPESLLLAQGRQEVSEDQRLQALEPAWCSARSSEGEVQAAQGHGLG